MTSDNTWSSNALIENTGPDGHEPTLASVGDRLHALWSNKKTIYHAYLTDGAWSQPVRVASGEQPVAVAAPDGTLHCLFANWFLGASQIYYVTWNGAAWSLPEAVSRTPGSSTHPALALGADGTLHAAWEDTTPGYATVYYGTRRPNAWTAIPGPGGRGSYPALGVTRSGEIYLAWQDRLAATSKFEIFCSINSGGTWSTPENVSDTPGRHSIYPRMAISDAGACHLLWQEEQEGLFAICYADRRPGSWAQPATLSTPGVDCRLGRIAVNRLGYCQALWAEGVELRHRARPARVDAGWQPAETADGECDGISDLAVCMTATGYLHALWSGYCGADARQLYHLQRQPLLKHSTFLPIIQG